MAYGVQFSELVINLRAETRRSSDVSVSSDDLDTLKRSLNGVYRTLAVNHDWPHLRHVFDKIPFAAGQRYYDFPAGFDADRVFESVVWLGSLNTPIKKGIDLDEYSFLDPSLDQRADPALAWDTAFDTDSGSVQIEFWPIPASASYSAQFSGYWVPPRLVDDSDPCLLDDELVLLFSSARMLKAQGAKDADLKLSEAQAYLLKLQQRPKNDARPVQIGLGRSVHHSAMHPRIVIKPSSPS